MQPNALFLGYYYFNVQCYKFVSPFTAGLFFHTFAYTLLCYAVPFFAYSVYVFFG